MKVQILMSTYNGAHYLRAQLDSIVSQEIPEKYLLIRDDGSTDATVKILEEYQKKYPWIVYYTGKNIGVQKSFFELIKHADCQASYIAFSDQDDIWMPQKLLQAVLRLSQLENVYGKCTPLLYCSAQELVDKNSNTLNPTVSRIVKKTSFGNALVQNICVGCTAVGNQQLIKLLQICPPVKIESVIMHDWWLYLTASCFGKVYYDPNPYIKYRQHGNNAFGVKLNHRDLLRYRLKELTKPRGEIYCQAECFWETFYKKEKSDTISPPQELKLLLKAKKSFRGRLRVALDSRFFRQKAIDNLVFHGILLLGKL